MCLPLYVKLFMPTIIAIIALRREITFFLRRFDEYFMYVNEANVFNRIHCYMFGIIGWKGFGGGDFWHIIMWNHPFALNHPS